MEFNPFSLAGKRILITGASSGLGRQIAIDCSRMGASVVIMGRNEQNLKNTYNDLKGTNHSSIISDLNQPEVWVPQILETIKENGPFDGFVHCAGIEKTQLLKNFKSETCFEIFNINFVKGIEILKILTKKGNYREIFKAVFIASITALIARTGTLMYTASKGAIVSAVRELALELAPKGINVNCISPGTVLTPMIENYLNSLTQEEREKRKSGFPLGLGIPKDISYPVIFLLTEGSRWITGQNIVVDGGYTIQ